MTRLAALLAVLLVACDVGPAPPPQADLPVAAPVPAPVPAAAAPEAQVRHTCPMHPEVHHEGPGSCPVCGMHLVPERGSEAGAAEVREPTPANE